MRKVLIVYGLLVLIIIVIVILRFRGINLLPTLPSFGGNETVTIEGHTFDVEIANDDNERAEGLSERDNLERDKGMLFIFEEKGEFPFWMKGVNFPLDIIYIADDTVVDVIRNAEPKRADDPVIPHFTPQRAANYVLEINGGLAEEYGIEIGDKVTFENIK